MRVENIYTLVGEGSQSKGSDVTGSKIAIISDIHANAAALQAVLCDMADYRPEVILVAGDMLGYYPDAEEVVRQIRLLKTPMYTIAGNHDMPVMHSDIPEELPYKHLLEHNLNDLSEASLRFLKNLTPSMQFEIEGVRFGMYHGTPDDPVNGRLYPDGTPDLSWFDRTGEDIIILGHTHYPYVWHGANKKLLINPGSVGQPRDGNPEPSWALLNVAERTVTLKRTSYDRESYAQRLSQLKWDERPIKALFKTKSGPANLW